MNLQRFFSLPHVLKPIILVLIFLSMIIVGATIIKKGATVSGGWFFWLTIIVQLVVMASVVGLFLFELELLATCGRDQWPVFEMAYSVAFAVIDIINMFIIANWNNNATTVAPIIAALFIFAMAILYGLGAIMAFRTWKGVVQSGANQNPTGNVQPGNVGNM